MDACSNESVTMNARVLRVCCDHLLVCDLAGYVRKYWCILQKPRCFRVGETVCIEHSGGMTMSIPHRSVPFVSTASTADYTLSNVSSNCPLGAVCFFLHALQLLQWRAMIFFLFR